MAHALGGSEHGIGVCRSSLPCVHMRARTGYCNYYCGIPLFHMRAHNGCLPFTLRLIDKLTWPQGRPPLPPQNSKPLRTIPSFHCSILPQPNSTNSTASRLVSSPSQPLTLTY